MRERSTGKERVCSMSLCEGFLEEVDELLTRDREGAVGSLSTAIGYSQAIAYHDHLTR